MHQLVDAVGLDVMSEASARACEDAGPASFEPLRAAWAAGRERHQLARLGLALTVWAPEAASGTLPPPPIAGAHHLVTRAA